MLWSMQMMVLLEGVFYLFVGKLGGFLIHISFWQIWGLNWVLGWKNVPQILYLLAFTIPP